MKFSCLASGSSGNCFYVENKDKAILVDAGISCKNILERVNTVGGNENKIKAILVTHEHIDHVRGIENLSKKLSIPIYATKGTIKNSFLRFSDRDIKEINNDEILNLADLEIRTFKKSHDAADPVSFQIINKKTLSIITDIGHVCKNVSEAINSSDYLVIESNHDIKMLETGKYPFYLKKRILSDKGHLSNLHSALGVLEHSTSKLKKVILSHLSERNNTPLLAEKTYKNILRERKDFSGEISISTIDSPTPLINTI